jgi:hypothetical protein
MASTILHEYDSSDRADGTCSPTGANCRVSFLQGRQHKDHASRKGPDDA